MCRIEVFSYDVFGLGTRKNLCYTKPMFLFSYNIYYTCKFRISPSSKMNNRISELENPTHVMFLNCFPRPFVPTTCDNTVLNVENSFTYSKCGFVHNFKGCYEPV